MNRDFIFIKKLKVNAIIGIYAWEREKPQPLIFDVEMSVDIKQSTQSDSIDDTVCYKTVADEIMALTAQSKHELIEALSEEICQVILKNHQAISSIKLSINKPQAVAQAKTVGLVIYRYKS
jgi:dihydroneopterin aldolase